MLKIAGLVLILVLNFFLCFGESNIPELRFFKFKPVESSVLTITESQPFQIVFVDFNAKSASCVFQHIDPGNLLGKQIFTHHKGTSVLSFAGIKGSVTTTWNCTLTAVDNSVTYIGFIIKVEAAVKLQVAIGDTIQIFTKSTETTHLYDGIIEYLCEDGETIDLTCSKLVSEGSLTFKYCDSNDIHMIETDGIQFEDLINFRVLMRAESNKSYVDCTLLSGLTSERQIFTYRITFIVKQNIFRNNDFIITVNDMKLTAHNKRNMYDYKFIYGDQLTVTCEKSLRNSITSEIQTLIETASEMKNLPAINVNVTDIERTDSKYRFLIDTKYLNKAHLMCYTEAEQSRTLASGVYFNVDRYDDGPAVLGLSHSDILYQYNTRNTLRFSRIHYQYIHYQYMVNQILNLTCLVYSPINGTGSLRWIYGKSIASTVHVNTYYEYQYINNVFKMDTESYHSITCKTTNLLKHRQIIIILHQKPGLPPYAHDLNVEDLHDNRTTPKKSIKDDQLPVVTIVGPLCGVLLAVGILVFYWWRRKRNVVATEEKPPRRLTQECNPIHEAADQGEYHDYESVQYDYEQNCAIIRRSILNNKNRPPAPPPNGSRLPKGELSPQHVFHERINHKVERPHESPKEKENLIPDRNSSRRDGKNAHIECEYDYVYNRPKKPPRFPVPPSDRGPRKPL